MTLHKGKPSGNNSRENRERETSSDLNPAHSRDARQSERYVGDDDRLDDNIRTRHPNRNNAKKNSPNGKGYRG